MNVLTDEEIAKLSKKAQRYIAGLRHEISELRAVTGAPAPEGTVIWKEAGIVPGKHVPDAPVGTKRDVILFGATGDDAYRVRIVPGGLEISLWSGRISLHPSGGVNNIVVRREK